MWVRADLEGELLPPCWGGLERQVSFLLAHGDREQDVNVLLLVVQPDADHGGDLSGDGAPGLDAPLFAGEQNGDQRAFFQGQGRGRESGQCFY